MSTSELLPPLRATPIKDRLSILYVEPPQRRIANLCGESAVRGINLAGGTRPTRLLASLA